MAKSPEEFQAHYARVRAEHKKEMTPKQRAEHEAALARKGQRLPGWDEFEKSLERSVARLIEACEGATRHHHRPWQLSAALRDLADQVNAAIAAAKEVGNA